MIERIGLHKMVGVNGRISTVKLDTGVYETMVLVNHEEKECIASTTLEAAKETHNRVMHEWNDKLYHKSIHKELGFANIGQFVKPIVTC